MPEKRILLVDGDSDAADLKLLLEGRYDCVVSIASNGDEGLFRSLEEAPDILFVNLDLERMGGRRILEALREKGLPIAAIAMGHEPFENIWPEISPSARGYLQKPLDLQAVVRVIDDTLGSVLERDALSSLTARADLLRVNRELQHRLKELTTLFEIGKSVTAMLDLDNLLRRVVEAAVFITGAEEGSLLLIDSATGELYMRAQQGLKEKYARGFKLKVTDSLAGSVVQSGKPVRVSIADLADSLKVKTGYLVASLLYVPLKLGETTLGVLGVDNKVSNRPFSKSNEQMLSALADYAAIAIENARLVQESQRQAVELDKLYKVQNALTAERDPAQALREVASGLLESVGADLCCIYPYLSASGILLAPSCAGQYDPARAMNLAPGRDGATQQVLSDGMFLAPDLTALPETSYSQFAQGEGLKACAGLALQGPQGPLGVAWVNFRQEHALSDQDIRSLYRISELATIILLWGGLEALVARDRPTPAAPVVFAADADLRTAVTTLRDLTGDRDGLLSRCESLTYDTTQYVTSLADRWNQLLEQGEIRPANLNRLLFRALDQVSMPANIEVVKKCAADLPPLVLNEAQLIEAFAILITNAVEAIAPRPGQIILHSRLSDDEREVIFEIEDTGIGMSEEVQRRAFEPLFTTKAPKSAPGLWFCRALLQNLGGDLTIGHSEMGKGSAFTITLPSRR